MKNCKRAIRRHHYDRLKRKRAEYYSGWPKSDPAALGRVVSTAAFCSCYMCGNQRHNGVRPPQERRYEIGCALDEDLIYHRGV